MVRGLITCSKGGGLVICSLILNRAITMHFNNTKHKLVFFSRIIFLPWCNKMTNTLIRGGSISSALLITDESLNCKVIDWRTNLIVSVQHLQPHPRSINSMSIWINIIFSYLLYKHNDSANELYNGLKIKPLNVIIFNDSKSSYVVKMTF